MKQSQLSPAANRSPGAAVSAPTDADAIAAAEEVTAKILRLGNRMQQAQLASAFGQVVEDYRQTAADERDVGSLRDYISSVFPRYTFSKTGFHDRLVGALQGVADGKIRRLMVFAPPRHGKSETVSQLFPSYFLARYPKKRVGMTSHTGPHALRLSRAARAYYRVSQGKPVDTGGRFAAGEWNTDAGGGLWAMGAGGAIAGVGYNVGIVDDPYSNAAHAASAIYNESLRTWWKQDFTARADEDDSAIIIVQTRWTEQDLSGWLLHREEEHPEHWTILICAAIKEATPYKLPPGVELIPDQREVGEPLFPERRSLERLERIKDTTDDYTWLALYQQRPQEEAGKGRVTKEFDRERNRCEMEPFDEHEEILVGMDFNVDPMSLAFCRKAGDQIHVVETLQIPDSNTFEACREIRTRYPKNPITVYPDPTGRARKTSAAQTDFAIIEETWQFDLRAPSRAARWIDRANNMNAACRNEKLFLNQDGSCEAGEDSLTRFVYKPGTSQPMKGRVPDYSHMWDAISYVVEEEAAIETADESMEPLWM